MKGMRFMEAGQEHQRHKILSAAAVTVTVWSFLDYKEYLAAIYRAVKPRIAGYSYLMFAEDLGFSKTNVIHLVIRGKRPLTTRGAGRVVKALMLSGVARQYFERMVALQNENNSAERDKLFVRLMALKERTLSSEEAKFNLDFFSEWYHIAIYELVGMASFSADPYWVADNLIPRIRPEQARKSILLLEKLGLIVFVQEKNCYEQTRERVTTGDEIASLAFVRYHQKMIEIGRESLLTVHELIRDVSSVSFSIPEEKIAELKREISMFRKRILDMSDEWKKSDRVYQMNIQLFPLSKKIEEDE
jgi:uncharacterized protein (TIGR02147 family)